MKKVLIIIATILILVGIFTGCQPTPEDIIVVGKDQEEMLKEANEALESNGTLDEETTISPVLQVPVNYMFNETGADNKLTITVDASVTQPDTDIWPTTQVVQGEFTQEMVYGILEYLFGDTPYYERKSNGEDILTKEEIQDEIVEKKAAIANGEYDEDMAEMVTDRIAYLESIYDRAPETKNGPMLSNGTMWELEGKNAQYIDVFSMDETGEINTAFFQCSTSSDSSIDAGSGNINYINLEAMGSDILDYTMKDALRINDDSEIPDDFANVLGVKLSDAQNTVKKLFDAACVKDMAFRAAYVINDQGTGMVDGYTGEAENYAIKLYYTRSINGAPILVMGDVGRTTESEYDYIWPYEKLEITINQNGIVTIEWNSPCAVSEVITDNTNIIAFDAASEIFETMIMTKYEARAANELTEKVDIEVDSVQLGLFRIKQQNTEGTKAGLYVPVWAFYGVVICDNTKEAEKNNGSFDIEYNSGALYPSGPYIVLAVNAIDGSIIDVERGY